MSVKPHSNETEPAGFVQPSLDSKPCVTETEETTTRSRLASVRKIPFLTQRQEAEAIDAKIALWKVRAVYCAIPHRQANLAELISDGMKAAAQLRISQQ